ncbi:type VI secretion system baseplate subunit TssG [Acidisoma silvae]|uniref:Type VI secretion system baseplate subunit TssG n=1 Tax=Acidisoma silvae TaxID=2802396 RepID=A0A963YUI5_9PROT|nr:type VI secretion system baseplate subunit TssG [Acidisoma silvae]MCB8876984.1 type VI secretion system baseplate subunit TssG [Acidisoma silvae]
MTAVLALSLPDQPAAVESVQDLTLTQSDAPSERRALYALPHRPSLLTRLLRDPQHFSFDAAIFLLMQATGESDPGRAVRFRAPVGLAFPASEILAVQLRQGQFEATVSPIGLTGPSGVLPGPYSDMVIAEQRKRSAALAAFFDLLAQRPVGLFAQAGIKYRPHRVSAVAAFNKTPEKRDPVRTVLMALCGYAAPELLPRLGFDPATLAYFAGHFATHPRSAERLKVILTDWLSQPVEIEQFAGIWLPMRKEEGSALPVALPNGEAPASFNQLGVDAAAGARVWDVQSRIVIHIGPLSLAGFQALLPGRQLLTRLVALVRAFLGFETTFAINPILSRSAVPPLELRGAPAVRLGWDSWLPCHGPRAADASDAVFEADFLEQQAH